MIEYPRPITPEEMAQRDLELTVMSDKTIGWQPIGTAPRDGQKFIVWDGWQQCLACYRGKYFATLGRSEDNRRVSEVSLWHALPQDPTNRNTVDRGSEE